MANPEINMAPVIDSKALPGTPANEWADSTASALRQQLNSQANSEPLNPSRPGDQPDGGSPKDFKPGTGPQTTLLTSQPLASSASTPGHEFPGAYPRGVDSSDADAGVMSGDTLARAKDQAYGLLDGAKSYLPAQEDVQRALQNAGDTARQYLPESVATYLPGTKAVSLPSSEKLGNQGESSDGVGALPGTVSETSLAKLPEERVHGGNAGMGGVGDLPGSKSEVDVARLPEERAIDGELTELATNDPPIVTSTNKHATTSMPMPAHGQYDHNGITSAGAGPAGPQSLLASAISPHPGGDDPSFAHPDVPSASSTNLDINRISPEPSAASEASMKSNKVGGVPRTSLLRHDNGDSSTTNLSTTAQAGSDDGTSSLPPSPAGPGVSGLVPAIGSMGVGKASHGPINPAISIGAQAGADDGIDQAGVAKPPVPPKDSLAMGPAKAKHLSGPMKDDEDKMHGTFSREQPPVGNPKDLPSQHSGIDAGRGYSNTADAGHSSTGAQSHARDNGSSADSVDGTLKHKPGFMDKLKGEAKVISGKIAKNEEKVEEGRRLMGKV